jgi:hypothetical protein
MAGNAQLDQTKLLEIAVQTVRFGIDRDAIDGREFRKKFRELGVGLNHFAYARNAKLRAPSSREIPSTKQQTIAIVCLLELRVWSFSGAWSLVLGAFPFISLELLACDLGFLLSGVR